MLPTTYHCPPLRGEAATSALLSCELGISYMCELSGKLQPPSMIF